CLGQLGVALPQHVVEVSDLPGPVLQIGGQQPLRLLGLGGGNSAAFLVKLGRHLRVNVLPSDYDLLLPLLNGGLSGCALCRLARKLRAGSERDALPRLPLDEASRTAASRAKTSMNTCGPTDNCSSQPLTFKTIASVPTVLSARLMRHSAVLRLSRERRSSQSAQTRLESVARRIGLFALKTRNAN